MTLELTACPWLVQPLILAEADHLHLPTEGLEARCQQAAICGNESMIAAWLKAYDSKDGKLILTSHHPTGCQAPSVDLLDIMVSSTSVQAASLEFMQ